MSKQKYEKAYMETILLEVHDVIRTSVTDSGDIDSDTNQNGWVPKQP